MKHLHVAFAVAGTLTVAAASTSWAKSERYYGEYGFADRVYGNMMSSQECGTAATSGSSACCPEFLGRDAYRMGRIPVDCGRSSDRRSRNNGNRAGRSNRGG